MNTKGITFLLTMMIAAVVIVLAVALANPIIEVTSVARNASTNNTIGLDCANTSISDFDQATCVATDLTGPFFLGFLISLVGIIVGARLVFGGVVE